MELWRGPVGKWLLSAVYAGVWVFLSLLLPWGLGPWFVAVHVLYAAWLYLRHDVNYGRHSTIRPLTPWDVRDYAAFRQRLRAASEAVGLTQEPVWAVAEESELNAWAVGGRRGVIVFTTGLLRAMPDEELLAIAGHELAHLRSRDVVPALVGAAWLFLVGQVSRWCHGIGRVLPYVGGLFLLISLGLDLISMAMGWLAGAVLAKRSRTAEHHADRMGARVTSVATMCAALTRLEERFRQEHTRKEPTRWTMEWVLERLHASHPPTEDRVAYLQQMGEAA